MCRTTGVLLAAALAAVGCGGSGGGISRPSPAVPVNLTVYINDARVSLSPDSVGAGAVVLIVTNQASRAQTLTLLPAGAPPGHRVGSTGSINPQGTAQLTVDLGSPGAYSLTTAVNGAGGAPPGTTAVQPATLHIGPARPSGSGVLLLP